MRVRNVLGDKIGAAIASSLYRREEHIGEPGEIKAIVTHLVDNLDEIASSLDTCQTIDITDKEASLILDYYIAEKFLSQKTANQVFNKYTSGNYKGSDEYKGTLYGLMMAVTEFGTYADIKDGVADHCIRTGGELVVVAPYMHEFMELVTPVAKAWRKKQKEKAKVKAEVK
jgi:hypothetical protein